MSLTCALKSPAIKILSYVLEQNSIALSMAFKYTGKLEKCSL